LALSLVVLAGCSPDPDKEAQRQIADGRALTALRQHFEARRQCAPVLTSMLPAEMSADTVERPSVRALLDNGLLAATPLDDGAIRLTPTPQAARWFQERRSGDGRPVALELCYARRQVTRVWSAVDGAGQPAARLHYAFRLVDVPAWARDARMSAAFPFLTRALSEEITADETVPYRDGQWDLTLWEPTIRLEGDVIDGFFP
jgi:hypothetical protein